MSAQARRFRDCRSERALGSLKRITNHHVPPQHPDPAPRVIRLDFRHHRAYQLLFGKERSLDNCVAVLKRSWWRSDLSRCGAVRPRLIRVNERIHRAYHLLFGNARSLEDCVTILQRDWWNANKACPVCGNEVFPICPGTRFYRGEPYHTGCLKVPRTFGSKTEKPAVLLRRDRRSFKWRVLMTS
jgi:hypothetical protein